MGAGVRPGVDFLQLLDADSRIDLRRAMRACRTLEPLVRTVILQGIGGGGGMGGERA